MVRRRGRIARWWLDRPLRAKGLAVLAPPVLVLVITVAASFIAETYQVVDTRDRHIDTLQTVVEVIDAVGLVIGVIGGVTAMVLFVRSIVRRIGEVGANAQRLGVFEPLLPVTPASDEIGQLAGNCKRRPRCSPSAARTWYEPTPRPCRPPPPPTSSWPGSATNCGRL